MAKELERQGIPTSIITAMYTLASNVGANRVVGGTKIPHPCGDPELPVKRDREISRKVLLSALELLERKLEKPQIIIVD
ncbi:MAG TPA: hypothetical protein DEF42_07675 [Desulfosporosinus sp.]|nr:hypothetical protein [Desulfosporosinus sp.]